MISLILIFFSFILLLTATNLIKCFSACCLYFCSKSFCYQLICSTAIQCILIVPPTYRALLQAWETQLSILLNEAYILFVGVPENREKIVQEPDNLMDISTMNKINDYFRKLPQGDYFRKVFKSKWHLC